MPFSMRPSSAAVCWSTTAHPQMEGASCLSRVATCCRSGPPVTWTRSVWRSGLPPTARSSPPPQQIRTSWTQRPCSSGGSISDGWMCAGSPFRVRADRTTCRSAAPTCWARLCLLGQLLRRYQPGHHANGGPALLALERPTKDLDFAWGEAEEDDAADDTGDGYRRHHDELVDPQLLTHDEMVLPGEHDRPQ